MADGMRGRRIALAVERPFLATCAGVLAAGTALTLIVLWNGTPNALAIGAPWQVVLWVVQAVVLLAGLVIVLWRRPSDAAVRVLMAVAVLTVTSTLTAGIAVEPDRVAPLSARILVMVVAGAALVRSWVLLAIVVAGALVPWTITYLVAVPDAKPAEDWPFTWFIAVAAAAFLVFVITREGHRSREIHGRLRAQAELDPLTGLLNRGGLLARGQELLAAAGPGPRRMWCAFVDVDGLKTVNDAHGHPAGDALLRAVANALTSASRSQDVVGRWGGDEFVVVGQGRARDAGDIADRVTDLVRHDMAAEPWLSAWSGAVSVGTAEGDIGAARSPASVDALLAEADQAMYRQRQHRRESGSGPRS